MNTTLLLEQHEMARMLERLAKKKKKTYGE